MSDVYSVRYELKTAAGIDRKRFDTALATVAHAFFQKLLSMANCSWANITAPLGSTAKFVGPTEFDRSQNFLPKLDTRPQLEATAQLIYDFIKSTELVSNREISEALSMDIVDVRNITRKLKNEEYIKSSRAGDGTKNRLYSAY